MLKSASQRRTTPTELAVLRNDILEEQRRLGQLLVRVDAVLRNNTPPPTRSARVSALDQPPGGITATSGLRVGNGNLAADRVAKLFGVSLTQLAGWLGRSKQAVSKTPDADSLQVALGYFERVGRLRQLAHTDAEFRQWLRTPGDSFGDKSPLDLLAAGKWQVVADHVDDILTGTPG